MAMAEVQSANTVGYVDITAPAGEYAPTTVMLADVGLNTIVLTNIVFNNVYRYSTIQIFGSDGDLAQTLTYNRDGVWEDDNGDDASATVFQPGDSFWVLPNRNDITIRFPGEVKTENLSVEATAGEYLQFGNGTPAAVSLSAMTFSNVYRYSTIQIFGSDGDLAQTFTYNRDGVWEDDNGDDASATVFQPGDSFWVLPNRNDITITIPSAL